MEPRIEYSPLIQQAGKPLYKGLFCASSDENIQGKSTAVLAQGVDFAWIFEEHRDSDRAKLWNMSYEHKRRTETAPCYAGHDGNLAGNGQCGSG